LRAPLPPRTIRELYRRKDRWQDANRYIPHTEEDCRKMLEAIGLEKMEDLFGSIPKECQCVLSKPLDLPQCLSEPDLMLHLESLQSPIFFRRSVEQLPRGRGSYRPFYPCGCSGADVPFRVLYRLHTLQARDQPGNAPGHLRIPEPHVPADRNGVSTPRSMTAPPALQRRCSWPFGSPSGGRFSSPAPFIPSTGR